MRSGTKIPYAYACKIIMKIMHHVPTTEKREEKGVEHVNKYNKDTWNAIAIAIAAPPCRQTRIRSSLTSRMLMQPLALVSSIRRQNPPCWRTNARSFRNTPCVIEGLDTAATIRIPKWSGKEQQVKL
jgi:hypothetical protein